jgi:hypothetical protein
MAFRRIRVLTAVLGATLWGVLARPLGAQATVVGIVRDNDSLPRTDEAVRTPFASVARQPLAVGMVLAVDDELRGETGAVVVVLRCAGGARVQLSGAFRALVQPAPPDVDCVFRLSSGSVDVQSETPTGVEFAAATLGSRHTQYAVHIEDARRGGPPSRALVFEGAVSLRTRRGEERPLTTGRGVAVREGRLDATEVGPEDIRRTAFTFAQVDVALAGISAEAARDVQSTLAREYAAVLTAPADSRRRVRLAATQLAVGVSPTAAIYQLNRAAPATADTVDAASRATVGYLRGVAYGRMGDSAVATREFETAARVDSASVERLIRQFNRLESPTYRAILRTRPIRTQPVRRDSTALQPASPR